MDLKLIGLYVGPDQMMPVASMLAAAMGFLLVFWSKLVGIIRKIFHIAPPAVDEHKELPPDSTGANNTPKKD